MHYLQSCLKGCDGKFRFVSVVVLKETISRLPESASERFAKQNLQIEKYFFSFSKKAVNSLFSLCEKKDDPLDKYKFKVNSRYSS